MLRLSPIQQIIITLAGPFAGFIFAALIIAGVIFMGGSVAIGLLFGFIPIPRLASLPVGGESGRSVYKFDAVGKYLLGIDQSPACLSIGWRQCGAQYSYSIRSHGWRTQVSVGFGDHWRINCTGRLISSCIVSIWRSCLGFWLSKVINR